MCNTEDPALHRNGPEPVYPDMVRRKVAKVAGGTAVIYIRVSSVEQADEGISLEAQRGALEGYCKMRGLTVAKVVEEAAVSAFKHLADRPGGREVLALVEGGKVNAVVVYKLDRAFRNTADCLATVADWDRRGVSLHLCDMGGAAIDTSSAVGKMFLTMLAGFAEFERNQTSERTAMVLASKAADGKVLGQDAPYGWAYVHGKIIEHPTEQRTIARVREWIAAGITRREVSERLEAEGVRSRVGGRFAREQLDRMLRGPSRRVAA